MRNSWWSVGSPIFWRDYIAGKGESQYRGFEDLSLSDGWPHPPLPPREVQTREQQKATQTEGKANLGADVTDLSHMVLSFHLSAFRLWSILIISAFSLVSLHLSFPEYEGWSLSLFLRSGCLFPKSSDPLPFLPPSSQLSLCSFLASSRQRTSKYVSALGTFTCPLPIPHFQGFSDWRNSLVHYSSQHILAIVSYHSSSKLVHPTPLFLYLLTSTGCLNKNYVSLKALGFMIKIKV